MLQMNLFTTQRLTDLENELTYGYQGVRVVGRDKLGVWD